MSKKMPWFKMYENEWFADVATLTGEQRGVYISLIAHMYNQDGPLENDPEELAMDCGVTLEAFEKALARLIKKGKIVLENDQIISPRISDEIDERRKRSGAARASVQARWKASKNDADASPIRSQYDRNTTVSENDTTVSESNTTVSKSYAVRNTSQSQNQSKNNPPNGGYKRAREASPFRS